MNWTTALTLVLLVCVAGWFCWRQVQARRAEHQQRQRIILESLTEWEQRRAAWQPRKGDGIRPVRHRF